MEGVKSYDSNMLQNVRLPSQSRAASFIALLVVTKISRSFGLFAITDVVNHEPVCVAAVLLLAVSSIPMILLQKPFSASPMSQRQWAKVGLHSFLTAVFYVLYILGLLLCGPTRSLLLADYSELAVVGIAGIILKAGSTPSSKGRGAILSLGGLVILTMWDDPSGGHAIAHVESTGVHQDYHTVRHNKYFSWLMVSDHSVGIAALAAASCVQVLRGIFGRRVAAEIGGAKRLQALSLAFATVILIPGALIQWHFHYDPPTESAISTSAVTAYIAAGAMFMVVLDFYIEKSCTQRLGAGQVTSFGMTASFSSCAILETLWSGSSTIGFATGFAFVLLLCGAKMLGENSKNPERGPLIGYPRSTGMYTLQQREPSSTSQAVKDAIRTILNNSDSKKIFLFLCINFGFMLIEFAYGMWTNSLGLISDAFHMLFDCTALVVGLYAAIMAKWKPSSVYTYGYARYEVLSGFTNGIFLVIVALSVFSEAIKRIWEPPDINTNRLLLVSVGGLLVNFVGIFAFSHAHAASHGHSHSHDHNHGGHSHGKTKNANLQGVFLHILADTLGSVGVIISSLLIENFGWLMADPICSLFIAILIFLSVIPLLQESASVLVLATPGNVLEELPEALEKITSLEDVIGYKDPHCWTHAGADIAATLHLVVQPQANHQRILGQVNPILKNVGITNVTVQLDTRRIVSSPARHKTRLQRTASRTDLSHLYDNHAYATLNSVIAV